MDYLERRIKCPPPHLCPRSGRVPPALKMTRGWHGARREIKSTPDLRSIALVALTVSKIDLEINRDHALGGDSIILRAVTPRRFVNTDKGLGLCWLKIVELPPEDEGGARWKILR